MATLQTGESFFHQVIGDFIAVNDRLLEFDTFSNRRELVRAAFSAVEGVLWQLKSRIFQDASRFLSLSVHEQAALLEESYSVDDRGNVKPQSRYLPIAVSVRLVLNIVQRYRPEYKLDLTHAGWQNLLRGIEVRNRIVHPKNLGELVVSDADIASCNRGFCWFLAFAIEVMAESKEQYQQELTLLSGTIEKTSPIKGNLV